MISYFNVFQKRFEASALELMPLKWNDSKFVHNRERSRAILMSIIIFDLDSFSSGTAENWQEENSAIQINKTKRDQRSKNLERDVGAMMKR